MKIQLYSDLHLEFADFEARTGAADVIVFAGDLNTGARGLRWLERLQTDKPVIYVLGNHEYYGQVHPKLPASLLHSVAAPHVHLLENRSVTVDGVHFHGCTLWSDFELFGEPRIAGYACQQVMSDFRKIRRLPGYSRLRSLDAAVIHRQSLRWLESSLQAASGPQVVITHHAPSLQSVPRHRREDLVSAAYASNLEDFIATHQPALWLHGHLHESADYWLGACRVVCNPRGYPGEFNPAFDPEKLIEVSA